VSLRSQLPAVVLLTDGCNCAQLVADTTAAVRADIVVITVTSGTTAPAFAGAPPARAAPQAQGKTVRALRDPTGELRKNVNLAPADGTAAALLVNGSGKIVRKVARTATIEDLRPDLARL
jgi:hypothetical protein